MSEQYRCKSCGYVFDMKDMMCSECGVGYFERLHWTKGGDGSHWEGCADAHWDCRIAQLEAELARRDEELALTEKKLCNIDRSARAEVARRHEIITRLKEDGEQLFNHPMFNQDYWTMCPYCDSTHHGIGKPLRHKDTCPVTLHRALMKELEEK